MPNILCPDKIVCPGSDFPIENYSAEDPDDPIVCRVRVIVETLPTLGQSSGNTCEGECAMTDTGEIIIPGIQERSLSPISIVTDVPTLQVGVPVAVSIQASGAPVGNVYVYSISSGALPAGLSLDNAGNLTGTPTTSGPYSFTVLATCPVCAPTTRTYSSRVVGAPGTEYGSPTAYYKCEELDGNLIDSVAGRNTVLTTGSPQVASGKIGIAQRMIDWSTRLLDPAFDINNKEFTVRFWFRTDRPSENEIIGTNQFSIGFLGVPECPTCSGFNQGFLTVYLNLYTSVGIVGVQNTFALDEQWHRIVCCRYFNGSDSIVMIQFDDQFPSWAPLGNVGASPALTSSFGLAAAGIPKPTIYDVDEVAFWNSFAMLKGDCDSYCEHWIMGEASMTDWNEGNGKTYPLA